MNRKEAFKQETRKLILKAARDLLLKQDVSQFTMRRVASEAGVSAASVVVHFKNKVALMEAALAEEIGKIWEGAQKTMPGTGGLAFRIRHIWLNMYTFYAGNRNLYRELLSSTIFKAEEDTPAIRLDIDTFFNFLGTVIEQEKAAGKMAPSVDSAILPMSLFSQYFCVLIMFFRDCAMTPEAAADMALAMNRQTLDGLETI